MAERGDDDSAIPQQHNEPPCLVKKPREKKPRAENPITAAVRKWLATASQAPGGHGLDDPQTQQLLLDSAPKRWVIYEPMVLLPSGSFTSDVWRTVLETEASAAHVLWSSILASLSPPSSSLALTHLAVNEGIPPRSGPGQHENLLRSPGDSLRMLYGDFGPADPSGSVTDEDLDRGFWVSTRQNGILQTWAPRWTMFSRGNVKEKARLLTLLRPSGNDNSPKCWAVDLYAGIGYFAFSYAARGLRVLAWELNPWSVEGLRRGGERNGWRVRVVREPEDLARHTGELLAGKGGDEDARIVVFQRSEERRVGKECRN